MLFDNNDTETIFLDFKKRNSTSLTVSPIADNCTFMLATIYYTDYVRLEIKGMSWPICLN